MATARPIPRAAPVTSAIRPATSKEGAASVPEGVVVLAGGVSLIRRRWSEALVLYNLAAVALDQNQERDMSIKGAMIAASVAGLFTMGVAGMASAKDSGKKGDDVMCSGVNACKGQSACKGGDNACKGKNGCKGQGNMKMSKADCETKGGKAVK